MTDRTPSAIQPNPADREPREVTPSEPDEASFWRRLLATNTAWIFLVLILLVAVFGILKPNNFPTEFNIRAIATNAAVLLIIAVGETFVIITGGIDLSVGYVLLFSGVTAAQAMKRSAIRPIAAGTSSCWASSSRSDRASRGEWSTVFSSRRPGFPP